MRIGFFLLFLLIWIHRPSVVFKLFQTVVWSCHYQVKCTSSLRRPGWELWRGHLSRKLKARSPPSWWILFLVCGWMRYRGRSQGRRQDHLEGLVEKSMNESFQLILDDTEVGPSVHSFCPITFNEHEAKWTQRNIHVLKSKRVSQNISFSYSSGTNSSLCYLVERNDKVAVKANINVCRRGVEYFTPKENHDLVCSTANSDPGNRTKVTRLRAHGCRPFSAPANTTFHFDGNVFYLPWSCAGRHVAVRQLKGAQYSGGTDFLFCWIFINCDSDLNNHKSLKATALDNTGQ